MQPRVAVAILAMKNPELLAESLDSIERHRAGQPPHQVVLVLNEASDEVREVARTRAPGAVIIDSPVNLGTGGGFNRAFAATDAEFMAIAHDDSQVTANWLSPLVERMDAEPSLGAVGGCIEAFQGAVFYLGAVVFRDGTPSREWIDGGPPYALRHARRDVDCHSGLGLLIRRFAWEAVGGFDDVLYYPGYHGDIDFCFRLRALGWRVLYEPQSTLYHHASRSTSGAFRRFISDRNRERFAHRHADVLASHGEWVGPDAAAIAAEVRRMRRTARPSRTPSIGADRAAAEVLRARLARPDIDYLRLDRDVWRAFATSESGASEELTHMDQSRRYWISVARGVGEDRDRWRARAADQAALITDLSRRLAETGEALARMTTALLNSRWWRLGERLRRFRP